MSKMCPPREKIRKIVNGKFVSGTFPCKISGYTVSFADGRCLGPASVEERATFNCNFQMHASERPSADRWTAASADAVSPTAG